MTQKRIFVTGAAGFIGYHLTKRFIADGFEVIALDSVNDFYNPNIKYARLRDLGIDLAKGITKSGSLTFYKENLQNKDAIHSIFENHEIDYVINLAAQAGVRYQFESPFSYVDSNLTGFVTLIEEVKSRGIKNFIYASSSSVYGLNDDPASSEKDSVDHPASLYAATKRANELIAHSYSNLFNLPTIGLRFFNVYGTWGRPDMFMYKLADSIVKGDELQLYLRDGKSLWRDYTFVSDITEGITRLLDYVPVAKDVTLPCHSSVPFEIFNIGRGDPIENAEVVQVMEEYFGKKANIKFVEGPSTEVFKKYADTTRLETAVGYKPVVTAREGVTKLAQWYKENVELLTN
ncbi:MAG: NAD-dependent epimerase/dehydratase family protein [Patescibacteria group bacterium]